MGRIPLLIRLVALALAGAALAPAAASAWMPAPVEFTRAVALGRPSAGGARAVAAAAAPVAATLRTRRRFDVVGVEWRGSPRARIELRVGRAGGGWSRWAQGGSSDDGPDAAAERASGHRNAGSPIWAGGADRVQLRVARGAHVRALRLRLINTTGSASAAARARTRALVARRGPFGVRRIPATSAPAPRIVPRSAWGAARCRPRTAPAYGDVRVAYVHHTVSLNGYSRAQAASLVLGICLFHRNGNGWNDIGYNFLVDRYGTIYEGRAGGVDAPVLGAQAGGFNGESFGVSVIGDFSRSAPPPAAMRSLARLIAWKLALHGVPARGRTQVTSAGGPDTGYPAGRRVTVNRISGHRDVDLTECPGNALYRRLPALRRAVARLEGAFSQLTIAPPAEAVPFGAGALLGGRLTLPAGASAAGATVELRQLNGLAPERTLATVPVDAAGDWLAQLPPLPASAAVRAVFLGDAGRPGVVSPPAYVTIVPQIEMTATRTATTAGASVVASGSVQPAKDRVTVTAYLERPDGSERRMAARTVSARGGGFRAKLVLRRAGSYRLVASAGADARSGAGSSAPVAVTVSAPQ